jgi:hypothetical protein
MTQESPEPSNADLLAFMRQAFAHLTTEVAKTNSALAEVKADVADVKGEIRATEASLTARIDAVQQVVRSVKADIAAHVDDREAHHRHAA